jgi:CubicO group peptidase (beta-lactamase class C family)
VSYRSFRVNGAAYGGLVGPAGDAARFVRAHLEAPGDGPRLLDPATVAGMQEITTLGKPYDHGLGWFRPRQDRQGQPRFVEHLGGGLGVYNTMRVYPDHALGVVIMSNTPGYDRDALLAPIVHSIA